MRSRYSKNKKLSIGDTCICPSCLTEFIKKSYQQVFCKTKPGTYCKDKYWNTVDPKKKNNKTRISPASQRWLDSREEYFDFDDDRSWDAHKDR